MRRPPAHAGRLRRSERCAFVGMFAVMAVLVVAITMSVLSPARRVLNGETAAAASPTERVSTEAPQPGTGPAEVTDGGGARSSYRTLPGRQGGLDADLTQALYPVAASCAGHLSVAVLDRSTGTEALYQASRRYPARSSVGADMVAVLLYQHQRSGTRLDAWKASLAGRVIENHRRALSRLWRLIGRARGFTEGARALRLTHLTVASTDGWRQVTTTAAGQLQLLADLTSPASPLAAPWRAYEVRLMVRAAGGSRAAAAAAASPGTRIAADNAWRGSLASSIAIVRHRSRQLLVVVLSQGCQTPQDAKTAATEAASDSAGLITAVVPRHGAHG